VEQTPWKGAFAVHYFMLCQRLLNQGKMQRAAAVASYLGRFLEILGSERVNCIVALVGAKSDSWVQCHSALLQLECIDKSYADIATELLSTSDGYDVLSYTRSSSSSICCCGVILEEDRGRGRQCPICDLKRSICLISGKVLKPNETVTCKKCGGIAEKARSAGYKNCGLCHDILVVE